MAAPTPGSAELSEQREQREQSEPRRRVGPLLIAYYLVAGSVGLLVVLGLVMVLSSSAVTEIARTGAPWSRFLSQAAFAGVGLVLLAIFAQLPGAWWRRLAWPALGAALALQLAVFVPGLGVEVGGNRNWISIGGQYIQPSEFLKLALVVWLGAVLAAKRRLLGRPLHVLIPVVPVCAAAIGVVLIGHDLGTAIVMLLLCAGAVFVAGVPLRWFVLAAVPGVAGLLFLTQTSNRIDRIAAWREGTNCTSQDLCWQTQHGTYALGTGGLFGIGLGNSREKWSYLPAAHNDFIFAIIGEELGLAGTLLVLTLFGLLAFSLLLVVRHHADAFAKIAAGALACWIVGQAAINIAVVTGLAPVIGLPLPFVSSGGSSLIACLAGTGIVLALIRADEQVAYALKARRSLAYRALAVVAAPVRRRALRTDA